MNTKMADWVRTLRGLAKDAGCEEAVAGPLADLSLPAGELARGAVVGGPKVGKSALVNAVVGQAVLPVSLLGEAQAWRVRAGEARREGSEVTVESDWLAAQKLELLEKRALDAAEADLDTAVEDALAESDFVILLLDATMPLRRAEAVLLEVCQERQIPVVTVLHKSDLLSDSDTADVLAYLEKHLQSHGQSGAVVLASSQTGHIRGTAEVRGAIATLLAELDISAGRERNARHALRVLAGQVAAVAREGLAASRRSDEENQNELRKRKMQLDAQSLVWVQIEQRVEERRRKLSEYIRQHLSTSEGALYEVLSMELQNRNDVRTWWQRDLPFRLQRELRGINGQISDIVQRRMGEDLRALQDELRSAFQVPAAGFAPRADVRMDLTEFESRDVPLWDIGKFRVFSRVGTAASVVMAGKLLLTAGWPWATIGLSMLAGLGAEQLGNFITSKDRTKVNEALRGVIQKATVEHGMRVSARLKDGYDEIVKALRELQVAWHQAQWQAIQAGARRGGPPKDWGGIVDRIVVLEEEMQESAAAGH